MRCIDWFLFGLACAATTTIIIMLLLDECKMRRTHKNKDQGASYRWNKEDIEMFLYDKCPSQQDRLDEARKIIMANYKDAYTSFFSAYSPSSITEHAPTTPELPHV